MKRESHGMKGTTEYNLWRNIKERCHNKNHPRFSDYGGRGITVCDKWRDSFSAFFKDMGNRPENMTLERVNNDLGYSKENCVWATQTVQNRNQRNRRDNTTSAKGIHFNKKENKFKAYIGVDKRIVNLGTFISFELAMAARKDAEIKYWGVTTV